TFADFKNAGMMDLHVFATDLNMGTVREFSFETSPGVVVAEAVRASMSIPMFFRAWQFSNNNPDNHIYVDGGMVLNFPIRTFDTGNTTNPATLGLFLTNLSASPTNNGLGYDQVEKYVRYTFDAILNAQNINFFNDPADQSRTMQVDNLGLSATNFGLTTQQETDLFNSGVAAATKFLNLQS
ncbi:MAG: patatin-like phospholipase family protein, partial [Bacteroidia bacterium]